MRRKRILLAGILGAALLTGPVFADFIHVPGAAFTGDSAQERVNRGYYLHPLDSIGNLYAPVELPHGAIIKNVRIFYRDNHATGNLVVSLYRRNLYNSDFHELFHLETSGTSMTDQVQVDSSVNPAPAYRKVYNNACQYYLQAFFSGYSTSLKLYGVTIEFE